MMNLDAVALALIVGLAIAIVEGIKQAYGGFAGKELPSGAKVVASVVVGTILASVAEFAPDTWVRIIPILTAGLASAGLYSISKRVGNGATKAVQTTRMIGSPEAFTSIVEMGELEEDEGWTDFLNAITDEVPVD